ncbi:MAG: phage antirepressor [Lachnospiraceae bacterium]
MYNEIQVYENEEFGKLDILIIDGKPYFPATDCAKILGYTNPRKAIRDHCRWGTKRSVPHPQNPEKPIQVNFIPEGDLYRLIIRSKLPSAERFEKWVFDEVLPSIRSHGAYITDETIEKIMDSPSFAAQLLQELYEESCKNMELNSLVDELVSKAMYYDHVLDGKDAISISIIAKDYGMSAVKFNHLLHALRVQYQAGDTWVLYQEHADKGYTVTHTFQRGSTTIVHTRWTQKGRLFIYCLLKKHGMIPQLEINALCGIH